MTLKEFEQTERCKKNIFFGTDLAILKLDIPAPENLIYPEIMGPGDFIEENTNGICIGYGDLNRNDQEKGPTPVKKSSYYTPGNKALFSCKVSPEEFEDAQVLYASYKALLGNGDESFIPTEDMLKTTGLPTGGSSGGPLLIQSDDDGAYKLAGILSGSRTLYHEKVDDLEMRALLTEYKVPIFPIWTDLRFYKDWILENMGPAD